METSPAKCDGTQRRRARALFDNRSECADELPFRRGELLTVLTPNRPPPDGWWLCRTLHGRQGLCPANRLRLLPELTCHKTDSKLQLRRAKSIHQSSGPDSSTSALQRGQLRRSASSLSGVHAVNQDTRTCNPETYDTPPSPRSVLPAVPVLEYDVPRPPASSNQPQWRGRLSTGPCLLLRAASTAGQAQGDSTVPAHGGLRAGYPEPAGTGLTRYGGRNDQNGLLHTATDKLQKAYGTTRQGDQDTPAKEYRSAEIISQRELTSEFPPLKRDIQMSAILAGLLDSVKNDEQQPFSPPYRWQSGSPSGCSSRPRSDNVDSCGSSSTSSLCSSHRFSYSTGCSWAVAPPVCPTAAPPVSFTVAPPVNPKVAFPVSRKVAPHDGCMVAPSVQRRTLLRLERELLCALCRVQERHQYPSQKAAALSRQLNVSRLHLALRDLLQLISCTAGAGAGQRRALAPLVEASRQLERAAGRQQAASWRLEAPADSTETDVLSAVRTLTAHLPLFSRPRAGRAGRRRTAAGRTTEPRTSTSRHLTTDGWPPASAAPPAKDNTEQLRTKGGAFSDAAVAEFYRSQCKTHQCRLREALERLTRAASDRQPASVLLVLCKFVVLSAHRLVVVGDAVGSGAEDHKAGWRVLVASDQLFIALRRTLRATKAVAAAETDSSDVVREMADASRTLGEAATALDRNMTRLSAMRDT